MPGPVSFSQIAAFRRCPLLCWLRYWARLPAPSPSSGGPAPGPSADVDPRLLGGLLHAAIRSLLDAGRWPGRGSPPGPGELEGLVCALGASRGWPAGAAGPYLSRAGRILETLWGGPLASLEPWPGGVELEVSWLWPGRGTRMVAVVDCLARTGRGRPLILDFKATGGLSRPAMEEYGHQLRLYRMGLIALEPEMAGAGLAVYHLPSGRLVPVAGGTDDDEATRRMVDEALEGMEAGRFPPAEACRKGAPVYCAYRPLCPYAAPVGGGAEAPRGGEGGEAGEGAGGEGRRGGDASGGGGEGEGGEMWEV
ncbi:MAG: PD-(D/E)XK nuclease family protein [Acetobacteraceae bacterium]|nr:PD-(D/E)XK nuclease family protein [Acetobacteraceae bacterium]